VSERCTVAPQLKNAVKSFARDAAILVAFDPEQAWIIFQELLNDIRRVNYYRPKKPKPSKPRVNKAAPNKWKNARSSKMDLAA